MENRSRFPSFPRTKVHDSIVRYSMFLIRSFASRFGIISQMKYLRVEISSSQTEVIKMLRLIHESNIYIYRFDETKYMGK